ncbi:MAG: GFA family protein [Hyphomonadaceae bacterium]|nr:GFA family protein [Hyphomonadaceae bacterium]
MSDWKLPWSASCLCGRVKMRVTAPPLVSMACHCRGCQKLTSGPYSLSLLLPAAAFEKLEGETELGGLHREASTHHFCAYCKNWLYTTNIGGGQFVNFRPAMLEDARWVVPYVESYVSEKLPQVVSGAKHSFAEFPPVEAYPELMAGFAREGCRPG